MRENYELPLKSIHLNLTLVSFLCNDKKLIIKKTIYRLNGKIQVISSPWQEHSYLFKIKTPVRESQNTMVSLKYSCTSAIKADCIRRASEVSTCWHNAPSQGRAAPYREVSHQFSPVGKRPGGWRVAGGGGTLAFKALWITLWGTLISHSRTLLWFYHRNHRGIYGAQILWIWLWQRSGEGLSTTSTRILSDQVHMCSAQVLIVIPTGGFAYLQKQAGGGLWPGSLTGCWSANLSPLREKFSLS